MSGMSEPATDNPALESALLRYAERFNQQLMTGWAVAYSASLMELSEQARSNELQFAAMRIAREVRGKQAVLSQHFNELFCSRVRRFFSGRASGGQDQLDDCELSMLADEDLERELAISSLTRRVEARCSESLFALEQRLAVVRGGRKLVEKENPWSPLCFGEVLGEVLTPLELNARQLTLAMRSLEKLLLSQGNELLQGLNQLLIDAGVLPNLRYSVRLSPMNEGAHAEPTGAAAVVDADAQAGVIVEAAAALAQAAASGAATQSTDAKHPVGAELPGSQTTEAATDTDEVKPRQAEDVLESLTLLRTQSARAEVQHFALSAHGQGYFSAPAQELPATSARASAQELLQATQQIDTGQLVQLLEQNPVPVPMAVSQFRQATEVMSQALEQRHIDHEEMQLIDLVGLLFEYLLMDEALPDALKATLSYLHTPYLKVALVERQWFTDERHPARLLLESLMRAGQQWVEADGSSSYKAFARIKQVVRHVLACEEPTSELFQELLLDFNAFVARIESSIAQVSRRAADKAEAEERLRSVKREVLLLVQQRLGKRQLPSAMFVLIMHPWRDYLTYLALRHGVEHPAFLSELQFIDTVIWSVEPKSSIEERNRLLFEQDDMQQRLEHGLHTIAYAQGKTNKLIDALHQAQVLALRNVKIEQMPLEKRSELEAQASRDVAPPETESLTDQAQQALDELLQLPPGTEFALSATGQAAVTVHIAWSNPKTQQMLLVDRSGKPLPMVSFARMADYILRGELTVVVKSRQSFIERALQSIFRVLKSPATVVR